MSAGRPPGTVALVDYGAGNLRSVENALREVGAGVVVTHDPEAVRRADRVVVPGQGAFGDCMDALDGPLGQAVREAIGAGTPYLGICLGLQVLFEESEEHGRREDDPPAIAARLRLAVVIDHPDEIAIDLRRSFAESVGLRVIVEVTPQVHVRQDEETLGRRSRNFGGHHGVMLNRDA